MRWKMPSGATAAAVLPVALTVLFVGCASTGDPKTIAALEARIADLEKTLEALKAPDKGVLIKVKKSKDKIRTVLPLEKKLCKQTKTDCPTEAVWYLSTDLPAGWEVWIRENVDPDDPGCFKPPGGATHWTLTKKGQAVSSGPVQSGCDTGAVWKYDVVLMQGNVEMDVKDPLFFLPFN
jgi:hypothetical protein